MSTRQQSPFQSHSQPKAIESDAFLVAAPSLYQMASAGSSSPSALATFLSSRERLCPTAEAALARAMSLRQVAYYVRIRIEILGEIQATVVPPRE